MRVTLAEAARMTHLPVRTLRRWAALGRLTVVHRYGRRWVDLEEVGQLHDMRGTGGRLRRSV